MAPVLRDPWLPVVVLGQRVGRRSEDREGWSQGGASRQRGEWEKKTEEDDNEVGRKGSGLQ